MINNVMLSGQYKGIENDSLLLKIDSLENNQVARINISEDLKEKLENWLKIDDVIGIKGYIDINDIHRIIVIATKIMFLSNK